MFIRGLSMFIYLLLCFLAGTALAQSDELVSDWLDQDKKPENENVSEDYKKSCLERRALRLKPVVATATKWVYCRHYVMGGSHYAYTEALSDAQAERTFMTPGSGLYLAEYNPDGLWTETALLESKTGCFRDVDVSPDGTKILYSYKASDRGDDFHLYEMDLASREVRQLTFGEGVADYEGCYLPDGHIFFNSTRCMQIVDCWWTEVSNIYRCDSDGKNITRITFDQVHDNYPTLTDDGKVLYTRWEYNDRSQMYPQPLFGMNVDGTSQRAVYGGNSWFPTTLIHARGVPNSTLFFGIATGHHSFQPGELMLFNPSEGREEASGAWQLEPLRRAKAEKIDAYGQRGRMAMYPYPIDEKGVVLSFLPKGWPRNQENHVNFRLHLVPFALYWTNVNGERELLVSQTGKIPCGRPVPVRARNLAMRSSKMPDETKKTGFFAIQDVYAGNSMQGIERGTVKSLRVVSIDYRPAGIGSNGNGGPGGGGLSCTPPAIGQGTWGVKRVLGEVPVANDGSVLIEAPIETPMYFMLLDGKGRMVQTMRSWTVLQPGETAACVGCHEPANQAPDSSIAKMSAKPVKISLPERGFSFEKDIQPILERRCVGCHNPEKNPNIPDLTAKRVEDPKSKRVWLQSYLSLTHSRLGDHWSGNPDHKILNWINSASVPTPLPPYFKGSACSELFTRKFDKEGHAKNLTESEQRQLACWVDLTVPFCGDYEEGALWNEKDRKLWERGVNKREKYAVRRF